MSQAALTLNLGQDPVRKCFRHFLMPAITGMVIKSLYIVADIMFIGHSMGEDGLAAINLVLPYFSFMFAVAMMVGVGGAALMSIRFGEGREEEGKALFQQALTFITLVMVTLTAVTMIWIDEIVAAFGATGNLAPMAKDYVLSLTWFATPYAVGWVLSNFIRNDGNPKLVMNAMIASATLNVFLDWLFMMVFQWGMFGAGLATGLAQLALAGVQLLHFRNKSSRLKLRFAMPDFNAIKAILTTGLATLFMEGSVGIVIMVSNWILLSLGGALYLSVYTVALNCMWLLGLLVYGICQAVQPLVSFNHGANLHQRILDTLNLGMTLVVIVCGSFSVIAVLFPGQVVAAFVSNPSPEMVELGRWAMRLYGLAAIPTGINILMMTIYQSTARSKVSSTISLLRSLILPVAGLLLLPKLVDPSYVWANVLIADLLILQSSLFLLRKYRSLLRKEIQSRSGSGDDFPLTPAF
ncbi:MATE family efflux transporter [Parendozoicomonas haliclonae]|uniref:Multidrug export protein MepA n=1 Tax=Parendozoicomonas haliclonae TaxID=1960125 RepID=A0A1X7AHY7_9GAMM|nr:MATE family efflux transporter [Parendozoicomonas haliclonae]SMA42807.1 Multidrug export protein MepA [Parendozoicomonas haliclonae]